MSELKGQARVGAERRDAIVNAAMEVFAQRGFRAGALADVGERVELTAPGILYHFGSKEALLLAVIAERDRRAADLLADMSLDGGLDSLRGIIRFAELSERERGLATLHTVLEVESLEPDQPAHAYFRDRSVTVRRWIAEVLRRAQKAGEVRPDVDCQAQANQVLAFLEGAAVLWLTDESVSLVDLYRDYLDLLTESIRT